MAFLNMFKGTLPQLFRLILTDLFEAAEAPCRNTTSRIPVTYTLQDLLTGLFLLMPYASLCSVVS